MHTQAGTDFHVVQRKTTVWKVIQTEHCVDKDAQVACRQSPACTVHMIQGSWLLYSLTMP